MRNSIREVMDDFSAKGCTFFILMAFFWSAKNDEI